ncbi:MAG TPA: hypothetical protein DIW17_05140, partial [Clostridiales bacterium]|nr:hypothetical protein [Clostridiales bacterium]
GHTAKNTAGVHRIQKCAVQSQDEGISIELDIEVVYGLPIHLIMKEIQENVMIEVGYATDLNILAVDVTARKVIVLKEREKLTRINLK